MSDFLNRSAVMCLQDIADGKKYAAGAHASIRTVSLSHMEETINALLDALAKREAVPFAYVAINDGKIVAADRDDEVIFYAIAGGLECDGSIYPAYLGEARKP